jgi:hypothetical protein
LNKKRGWGLPPGYAVSAILGVSTERSKCFFLGISAALGENTKQSGNADGCSEANMQISNLLTSEPRIVSKDLP